VPHTSTYGQTFVTPSRGARLASYSLFLHKRFEGQHSLPLRGYVGEWDGEEVTRLLYESSIQTMNASGDLQEFSFSPGLILNRPGKYVAFLSVAKTATPGDVERFGMPIGQDRIAGHFVFNDSGFNSDRWFSPWESFDRRDVWFQARFVAPEANPTPEPPSIALLALGAIAVMLTARHARTSRSRTSTAVEPVRVQFRWIHGRKRDGQSARCLIA
jgi:hypothetical protein